MADTTFTPGAEFLVNTTTANDQLNPSITALSDGGYIIVWQSSGQDGSGYGVYAQRYNASGVKVGAETLINDFVNDDQILPVITALNGGGYVIAWQSDTLDGYGRGIVAQRYDAAGAKVGSETVVNTFTDYNQTSPAITALNDGGYIIAWTSIVQDSSGTGVYAQRFNANGGMVGSETLINTTTDGNQSNVAITALSNGGYVITWNSHNQDGGDDLGVFAQIYNSAGEPVTMETQINTFFNSEQSNPSITALSNGGFIITWQSYEQDESGSGIYAKRFNSSGVLVGSETIINTTTSGNQLSPVVAALSDGGYVITWVSAGQDGSGYGIYAQRFNASGSPVGSETLINTYTTNNQEAPSITALSDGGYVITWHSYGQDGSGWGIYAKQFSPFVNTAPALTGSQSTLTAGTEDTAYVVTAAQLLAGFTDADNDTLSVTGLTASNGTVVNNGDGTYTITPAANFNGAMTLSYSVSDGAATTAATLGYTVTAVNDAPALTGSQSTLSAGVEDTAYVVTAAQLLAGFTDADNDTLSVTGMSASNGTVVNNGNGTYTITPSANFNGAVTLNYNVSDGTTTTAATLGYTLTAVNDPTRAIGSSTTAGSEFLVNTATLNHQFSPDIVALSDGGFVVTWSSIQDGSGFGVYSQRYDANGVKVGAETLVNTHTSNNQYYPYIAALNDGGYIITWSSEGHQDGSESGTYAQRYNAAGVRVGVETRINTTTASYQNVSGVTGLSDGGYVIVWFGPNDTDSSWASYAQRFDASGNTVGVQTKINTTVAGNQSHPSIAAHSDGGYIVTWESQAGQDGDGNGIYAQIFAANGDRVGGEILINTTTSGNQSKATVAMLDNGDYVVTWMGNGTGDGNGVFTQRLSATGAKIGTEVRVNTLTPNDQEAPYITALSDGGYVIAWKSFRQDGGENWGVFAQRFDASGAKVGSEFLVNFTTANNQDGVSVTELNDGSLVFTWESSGQDGSDDGVYARRFSNLTILTSGSEDTAYVVSAADLLAQFRDADSDTLTIASLTASSGTVVDNGDGTYTITQAVNFNGSVTLSLGVNDGTTTTIMGLGYTVAAANDAPALTGSQSTLSAGTEDTAYVVTAAQLLAGFTDIDGNTLSVTGLTASNGTVVNNGNGTYTITPSTNFNGSVTLNYNVSDGTTTTAATLGYNVTAVNDAPALTGTQSTLTAGTEDTAYTVTAAQLLAGFADVDNDTLSVTGLTASNGTVVNNGDGTFTITPAANFNGAMTLNYGVSDGTATMAATLGYTVTAVNDAPALTETQTSLAAGTEDVAYTVTSAQLLAGYTDAEGQALSVTGLSASHGTVVNNGNGTYTITPRANYNGTMTLSYGVSDGTATTNATLTYGLAAVIDGVAGYTPGSVSLVNADSDGDQNSQSVTALSDGGYVIVFTDWSKDGSSAGIFARRFNASGQAVGSEFRVNTTTLYRQDYPFVSATADGGFVVAWYSNHNGGNYYSGGDADLYVQRYDSSGNAVGGETKLSYTSNSQDYNPQIAGLANGGYVITWYAQDSGNTPDVAAQAYDANGNTVGSTFVVNTYTSNNQTGSTITALADGGYIITWDGYGAANTGVPLTYGQRFDSSHLRVGSNFVISNYQSSGTSVTELRDGGFVVSFTAYVPSVGQWGLYFQRFDAAGVAVGTETRVSPLNESGHQSPNIVSLNGGGFIVVWSQESSTYDYNTYNYVNTHKIFYQQYDANGNAVGSQTLVVDTNGRYGREPQAAVLEDGSFVITYYAYGQSNYQWDVYQKFYQLLPGGDPAVLTGTAAVLASGTEDEAYVVTAAQLLTGYTDEDGNTLSVVNLTASNGTVVNNGNGTYTITPAVNFNGTMTLNYSVSDGSFTTPATLQYGVAPVADAPVLTGAQSVLTGAMEDTAFTVTAEQLMAGYTDYDGDTLMLISTVVADYGTVTNNGDGTYTIVPNADFKGTMNLGFTITDGAHNVFGQLSYQVASVNDALAQLTGTSAVLIDGVEDQAYTVTAAQLLQGFTDYDSDTLSIVNLSASNGTVVNNGNGTYTITPALHFNGTMTLSYGVSDGTGSTPATINYAVGPVADAPLLTGTQAQLEAGTEDVSYTVTLAQLLEGFTDGDNDELDVTDLTASNGTILDNGDGTFSIKPSPYYYGTMTLTYKVTDGQTPLNASISYTVTPVNAAPAVTGDQAILSAIDEDQTKIVTLAQLLQGITDGDVDGEGNAIDTLSIVNFTASNGTVVNNGNGTWTITPAANFNGTMTLNYGVFDGVATSSASLSYGMNSVEDLPTLIGTPAALSNGTEDQAYTVTMAQLLNGYTDGDIDALSVVNLRASHGTVTDLGNGNYRITPRANYNGVMTLSFGVTDGKATVDASRTFTLAAVAEPGAGWGSFTRSHLTASDYDIDQTYVTALNDGGYVVFYSVYTNDWTLKGQRFDATGAAVGGSIIIDRPAGASSFSAYEPQIAALSDDGFVVGWYGYNPDKNVAFQRFDANGQKVGGVVEVADTNYPHGPVLQGLPGGGFLIAWQEYNTDGSGDGVYARVYDANNQPVGNTFLVNSYVYDTQNYPEVTALSDGTYVITWNSYYQDGSENGIYGQRYDANHQRIGSEFRVNTYTNGNQTRPNIVALSGGGFAVSYYNYGPLTGYQESITYQVFNASGQAVGSERTVTHYIGWASQYSDMVATSDGGFIIAWAKDGNRIEAQQYDANGNAVGGLFYLYSGGTGNLQPQISLTLLSDGQIVTTFRDYNYSTYTYEIYTSRINFIPGNELPVLTGAPTVIASGVSGTDVTVTAAELLAGFTDEDGQTLSVVNLTASNGTVINNGDGTYRIVTAANFQGTMTLNYSVSDGTGTTSASLSFEMVYGNRPPVLTGSQATLATTAEDEPYLVTLAQLLAGFTDHENNNLSITNLTASNGTVVDNGNGTWTVTPAANFNGAMTLNYNVTDGVSLVAANLTHSVTAVNDGGPSLSGNIAVLAQGTEDTAYTVSLAQLLQGFVDPDGDVMSVSEVTATHGTVVDNGNGTWTITPQANFHGTMAIFYGVTDGDNTTQAALILGVGGVNDAPVLSGTQSALASGAEDTAYTVTAAQLLAGFSDIERNTLSITGLTASHGVVVNNFNGTYTITPNANFNGAMTLSYNVSDGTATTAATLGYTVTAVNDAGPALTGTASTLNAGTEDTAYVVTAAQLLAGFSDVDGDTISVTGLTASNGTVVDNGDGTYTITPALNFNGSMTLSYGVTDGTATTAATLGYTVGAVNDAPVLSGTQSVLASGAEDTAYTVTAAQLLAGFSDVDNDTLSVTGLTASNGTVVNNGDGTYTITPAANFNGAMSLSYGVSDGTATIAATLGYTVNAVNDAPALTGTASTLNAGTEDTAYTVTAAQLLAGFSDVDGDTLSVTGLTASNGTVVNNGDGTYTITPALNFNGSMSLSYGVSDGTATTAATLGYTVGAVNDAPALTGTASRLNAGTEDTAYTVTAAQLLAGFSDVEGSTLSVTGLTASNGTVVDNGDGTYTITPALNFNGSMTLSYGVSDGTATTATTLGYTVGAVNDAPVLSGTQSVLASGAEDTAYTVTAAQLLAGFSDVDNDTLSVTGLTASNGTVVNNGDGTYTITPAANFNGSMSLSYGVSDGTATTAATLGYTVGAVNDKPVLTGTASTLNAGTEDTAYTVTAAQLLAGFTDVEGSTLSVTGLTASNGTVVNNGDGTYTITPAANFNGGMTLSYGVSDGTATTAATLGYTVGAVNDAPALTGSRTSLSAASEDTAYTVTAAQLLAGFSDVDGDTLSVTGLTASNGTVVNNGDGTYTITPAANFNGAMSLSYGVSDGTATTAATLGYTVGAVNDKPVLTGTASTLNAGTEDTAYIVTAAQLLAGFSDVDVDNLSVVNLTVTNGIVVDNGNGTYTITPAANFNGTLALIYGVSDGHAVTSAALALNIVAVNDAPVLTGTASVLASGTEDTAYTVTATQLLAGFSDVDGNTLSVTGLTASNGSVVNNGNGTYTITPALNFNGAMSLSYGVSDGTATIAATLGYTVNAVNDAPALTGTASTLNAGTEDTAYTVTAAQLLAGFSDVDGDTLSVTGLTASNGTVVNNGDGTYTITPALNFNGSMSLSYGVSDGTATTAATLGYTVGAVNDAPALTGTASRLNAGTEDTAYTVTAAQLLAGFSDVEGSTLSVTGLTASNGTVVDNGDGTYTITPAANFNGAMTLSYGVSDGTATTAATLGYTVGAVNDAPVLSGTQSVLASGAEDTAYTVTAAQLLAGFSDVDNDTLSVTGLTASNGTVVDNGNGTFTITPAANFNGSMTLSYSVSDGTATIAATLGLNIAAVVDVINGTPDDDALTGTDGNDIIDGLSGFDVMTGGNGDDIYYVDSGGDGIIETSEGGNDTVVANLSHSLWNHVENLTLAENGGNLNGYGNGLSNILRGNAWNNILDGRGGSDTMYGGTGNDIYYVDNVGDIVSENVNEGVDTTLSSISYTLTDNVETLILTGSEDLYGNGNSDINTIYGNSGNNILDGGANYDSMLGGAGNDIYYVDHSWDYIVEFANEGTDHVISSVSRMLNDNLENLTITGTANINAYGNELSNIIIGNAGDNILDGRGGADIVYGGGGNDIYYIDNAGDVISEETTSGIDDGGIDWIVSTVDHNLGNYMEHLILIGSANINATGNAYANTIEGNFANNIIDGGTGNDTLRAHNGDDTLIGGAGNDNLLGGAGNDTYEFGMNWGQDTINDISGSDTIRFTGGIGFANIISEIVGDDIYYAYAEAGKTATQCANWIRVVGGAIQGIELISFASSAPVVADNLPQTLPGTAIRETSPKAQADVLTQAMVSFETSRGGTMDRHYDNLRIGQQTIWSANPTPSWRSQSDPV